MVLSDGSHVPAAEPQGTDPADRARSRFAVPGNAIVAGGAGDIGIVACRALLEHGLQGLAIFDIHPDIGEASAAKLQADFPHAKVAFKNVDITDATAVTEAVAQTEELLGPVRTCVCFAGIVFAMDALDIAAEQFRKMIDVNTTGTFLCAQAVARSMAARGTGGSIILTASISGQMINFPQPQVHYNASKAAVISMKSSLAAEWGRHGIRVNSISPGYMDTILNQGDGLAAHRRVWVERTPLGRLGEAEELTGAVVLLASNAGSFMTGADILVDGGISVF